MSEKSNFKMTPTTAALFSRPERHMLANGYRPVPAQDGSVKRWVKNDTAVTTEQALRMWRENKVEVV